MCLGLILMSAFVSLSPAVWMRYRKMRQSVHRSCAHVAASGVMSGVRVLKGIVAEGLLSGNTYAVWKHLQLP